MMEGIFLQRKNKQVNLSYGCGSTIIAHLLLSESKAFRAKWNLEEVFLWLVTYPLEKKKEEYQHLIPICVSCFFFSTGGNGFFFIILRKKRRKYFFVLKITDSRNSAFIG